MYYVAVAAATMIVAMPVVAQEPGAAARAVTAPVKAVREAAKEKVQEAREAVRGEVKDIRAEAKRVAADLRVVRVEKREQFKKEISDAQEKMRARVQEKKDELKANLAKIKDEKKRAAVERIYAEMTKLNATRTDRFTEALEKLEAVTERVRDRSDKAKEAGRDVVAVEAAIADALKAIDAARLVVKAQAGQVYKLGVESEATLKTKAGNLRKVLHEDLKKTEDAVKAAREAVQNAARELGKVPGIKEFKTPAPVTAPVAQ